MFENQKEWVYYNYVRSKKVKVKRGDKFENLRYHRGIYKRFIKR